MGKSECKCDCEIIHADIVTDVKEKCLKISFINEMSNFYKAFSDETRLKIINLLDIHEMCVCDISVVLNMTKSAISHQLKYLKNLNIITSRREGKIVFYALADEHVKQLFEICQEHIKENINEADC